MKKLRLGIIGAGGIVQLRHLPFLSAYEDVEVVAIADTDRLKAGAVADKFGVKHNFRLADDLVARSDIDAVIITTPNNTHLSMSLAAFAAKKHVLVERPMARNYSEAKRMVEAADAAGCRLMVAMNHRFRPDSLILQNLISKNELGKVYHIKAGWLKKLGSSNRPDWTLNPRISGGGVMMDLGIQLLDLSLWIIGLPNVEGVIAKLYNRTLNAKVEDYASVCMLTDNDCSINLEAAWEIPSKHTLVHTIIHGENGLAWLNPLRIHRLMHGDIMELTPGKQYNTTELYDKSYENEIRHFVESVRSGRQPVSSGEENLKVMRALEMIYRSAKEKRFISAAEV